MTERRDDAWPSMHDWPLVSVTVDWEVGTAAVVVEPVPTGKARLIAVGLRGLHLPRAQDWGPSVFIRAVEGPVRNEAGSERLAIEMASGDVIEIVADRFQLVREDEED